MVFLFYFHVFFLHLYLPHFPSPPFPPIFYFFPYWEQINFIKYSGEGMRGNEGWLKQPSIFFFVQPFPLPHPLLPSSLSPLPPSPFLYSLFPIPSSLPPSPSSTPSTPSTPSSPHFLPYPPFLSIFSLLSLTGRFLRSVHFFYLSPFVYKSPPIPEFGR